MNSKPQASRSALPTKAPDAPDAPKWVCYYRVSTARQGESGLGLEAQHAAVNNYIKANGGAIIAEFTETESGKKASNRPALLAALELSRKQKATLAIAKLDRLARNVHFISGLLESGVNFVAVDQPMKDRFMLHVQAAFAEEEARRISVRTKEALAAAKRRGVVIGATGRERAKRLKAEALERATALAPLLAEMRAAGITQTRQIRNELNRRSIPSPGGGKWHLPTTHRTLMRLIGNSRVSASLRVDEGSGSASPEGNAGSSTSRC
jgi:DNA invertase Pin-like site-specific DNA recombinase